MLLSALQEYPRCALCMGTILWPICELIDSKLAQRSDIADHKNDYLMATWISTLTWLMLRCFSELPEEQVWLQAGVPKSA